MGAGFFVQIIFTAVLWVGYGILIGRKLDGLGPSFSFPLNNVKKAIWVFSAAIVFGVIIASIVSH